MLHVRLLGPLEVTVAGRAVEPPASRRAWSLLAWLALHPGEHPRSVLAARFWPDVLDSSARASLRSAAWGLRRALGPAGATALEATRDRVSLRCATDLQEFDALLARGSLEAAAALPRGPLLADLDEDWVLEERDRQTARLSELLATLAERAPSPQLAVAHARRRHELDPLDEAAACDLMERLTAAGERAAALGVHDRLAERLRTHLGLAPSARTRAAVALVRSAPAPAEAVPASATAVIGREGDLDALLTERTGVAVLRGGAGIGKTHLARAVLERARDAGARTAACAAPELGGPAPFSLWSELLRNLAEDLPPPPPDAGWPEDLAAIAPSLPRRLGCAGGGQAARAAPELARSRLQEAAVDAIEHAAADRSVVLLFDDVHLADAASLELLAYVLRRAGELDVMAVLTCRPVPERPDLDALLLAHAARGGNILELDLAPLPRAAVERLVASVATLRAAQCDDVVAAAEGNPLLAVECARAAAAGHDGPPPSLQAVARAAVGRLPSGARRAAELAAVAGRDLTIAEIGALAGQDHALRALDCGLLTCERGAFGYRHALLRDAALAHLPEMRRRALHDELAGTLRGPAAEAARHLRLAGRDADAAERLARAARDATSVGAVNEAAAFMREALELRPDDPALLVEMAQLEAFNGQRDAADEALRAALAVIDPAAHAERARIHVRAARWYSGSLCRPRDTAVQTQLALAELDCIAAPDPALLTSARTLGAWAAAVTGRIEDADALLAGIADGELDDLGLRVELAHARAFRALADDRLEDAAGHFATLAGAPGTAPDRAYGLCANLACVLAGLGRHEDALYRVDEGIVAVRGLPGLTTPTYSLRAMLLARLGRLDEARDAIARAREAAQRSGDHTLAAAVDHDAGTIALASGQYAEAAALLARALRDGASVSRPLTRLAAAEALARLGRPDDAAAELRAATLEPVAPGDRPAALVPRLTHVQALIALARGDDALALRRLGEAAAGWRRLPGRTAGDDLSASLLDLGRPTLAPVEPARELARVERDLQGLTNHKREGAAHAPVR